MTITIKEIKFPPHIEKVKFADGKPGEKFVGLYTITDSEIGDVEQATVETFAKTTDFLSVGAVLEATKREYKGVVSYSVKNPKSQQGAFERKSNYTPPARMDMHHYQEVYQYFWLEARRLAGKDAPLEIIERIFDRILSCGSVMVDIKSIQEKPLKEKKAKAATPAGIKITPATPADIKVGVDAARANNPSEYPEMTEPDTDEIPF